MHIHVYVAPMLLERVTTIIVTINGHVETKAKNARSCPNIETLFVESCYLVNPPVGSCGKTVT